MSQILGYEIYERKAGRLHEQIDPVRFGLMVDRHFEKNGLPRSGKWLIITDFCGGFDQEDLPEWERFHRYIVAAIPAQSSMGFPDEFYEAYLNGLFDGYCQATLSDKWTGTPVETQEDLEAFYWEFLEDSAVLTWVRTQPDAPGMPLMEVLEERG